MKHTNIFGQLVYYFKLFVFVLPAFILISCNDEEEDPAPVQEDIVQIVVGNEDFSILEEAVKKADLTGLLSGTGPFTVFAPTDDAFEAANITMDVINSLSPDQLEAILSYHVLNGEFESANLSSGSQETLLTGATVEISVNGGTVTVNNATVTTADIEATNGIIHIINQVLLPPAPGLTDAASAAGLNSLLAAIESVDGLLTTLQGADDLTIFAPTDAAFNEFLMAIGKDLDDIPMDVLETVLSYHVVQSSSGPVASSDLQATQDVTTLANEEITIVKNDNGVFLDPDGINAQVTTPDVTTESGIVHVINKVLIPPSIKPIVGTIVAPAYFDKEFTTLVSAVLAADESILTTLLVRRVKNDDFRVIDGNRRLKVANMLEIEELPCVGMTLFAPTNAAFEAAGITDLSAVTDLEAVLTYHLLDGTVTSDQVEAGAAATVNGENIYFSIGDNVVINGKTIVTAVDLSADNGVVHVIDQTLIPPASNIAEIVKNVAEGDNPEYTVLLDLIGKAADLPGGTSVADVLSGDGPFTVFAPTDAAFAKIPQATLESLTSEQIRDILLYHVVPAAVFSSDLTSGSVGTALADQSITIDAENLTVTDNNDSAANITPGENNQLINILATNGVIHTIDNVLLPF